MTCRRFPGSESRIRSSTSRDRRNAQASKLPVFLSVCCLWTGSVLPARAKDSPSPRPALRAVPIDTPPDLDGLLNDPVWLVAPAANGFVQMQPEEGRPATEDTEVRIVYDDDTLYIGILCRDSEPERIVATEKRRDSSNIYDNDHIQLLLDTFHDRMNGYVFVTNPLSAKLDLQVRKEGKAEGGGHIANPNLNINWDGVWEVRAAVHESGWSAEIEIPLNTLRFHEDAKTGWGINVLRNIRRKNEESTWSPLPRNQNIYKVSLAGELTGLEKLRKGLNLQVKPYILADRISQRDSSSTVLEPAPMVLRNDLKPGVDLKYGVTSDLTLDVTANTDFSQVEADDQQINLTRFSLYFPEKREFFLENSALLNVGTPDDAMIFFSRRIGISPEGEEIPLWGGVKLTGKAQKFNVGFVNMQTKETDEGPSTNFSVLRVGRDIFGSSTVGFLMTNRQSSIDGDYNRAYTVDADFIFGENLSLSGYYARSSTPGLDGQDGAGKVMFQWVSDLWNLYGYVFDIEENFNAEMGFVKRTGIRRTQTHIGFTPEPDVRGLKRLNPHVFFAYTTDQQNNLLLREEHAHMVFDLVNGGSIGFQWNEDHEFVDSPFPIQEDIVVPVGTYTSQWWMVDAKSDRSRSLYGSASYRWGDFYGGGGRIANLTAGLKPTSNLWGEVSLIYNDVDLPQGDFTNHILGTRFNYNFSTRLALMGLIQWNSDIDEVGTNVRLRFIHSPGSDLYVVYNERRLVEGPFTGVLDRTFAVKMNYLMNF